MSGLFPLGGDAIGGDGEGASAASYTLSASEGSFSLSGVAASPEVSRKLTAVSGSFDLGGQGAALEQARKVSVDGGSFSLSGQSASSLTDRSLIGEAASYLLTGLSTRDIDGTSEAGAFYLAGGASYGFQGRYLASSVGAFNLEGTAGTSFIVRRLLAASGSFASTGNAARLLHYRLSAAATGQFALAGEAAQPRYDRVLAAEGVGVTLGGSAGFLKTARRFGGHSGPFALSGYSAGLQATKIFVTLGGEITLAGEDSGALRGYVLHAGTGEFHLYEGRAYTRLVASRGQFELEGQNADLSIPVRRLSADTGAVQLQGQSVTLRRGFTVRAERGQFALTGGTSLRRIRRVSKGGRYHLTAYNAELWTGWGGDAVGSVSAEAIVFSGGFGNSTRGVGAGSIAQSGAASASILVPVATSRFSSPVAKSAVSAGRKGFKQVR